MLASRWCVRRALYGEDALWLLCCFLMRLGWTLVRHIAEISRNDCGDSDLLIRTSVGGTHLVQ